MVWHICESGCGESGCGCGDRMCEFRLAARAGPMHVGSSSSRVLAWRLLHDMDRRIVVGVQAAANIRTCVVLSWTCTRVAFPVRWYGMSEQRNSHSVVCPSGFLYHDHGEGRPWTCNRVTLACPLAWQVRGQEKSHDCMSKWVLVP